MSRFIWNCYVVVAAFACISAQNVPFPYERSNNVDPATFLLQESMVPNCPLESHPDTQTMFIMRGPLGDPQPRTCPPGTYFLRSVCSCVNNPMTEKCNLRPSALGPGWYDENVFGVWIQRPCAGGAAFNPSTCDCSLPL